MTLSVLRVWCGVYNKTGNPASPRCFATQPVACDKGRVGAAVAVVPVRARRAVFQLAPDLELPLPEQRHRHHDERAAARPRR